MLDLVIHGGQVVTPQDVGAWDVGVAGERPGGADEPRGSAGAPAGT